MKTILHGAIIVILLLAIFPPAAAQYVEGVSRRAYTVFSPPVPKATQPAILSIGNVRFTDANSNGIIDAEEQCTVAFTITNSGPGSAYRIMPLLTNISGIKDLKITGGGVIKQIKPGESADALFYLAAGMDIQSAKAQLGIYAEEANGFNAAPQELVVSTYAFIPPQVVVADARFTSASGGTTVNINETVTLSVIVQNKGQGTAENVSLTFTPPTDVLTIEERIFAVGTLRAGETRKYDYTFFVKPRHEADKVDISVVLAERHKRYGQAGMYSLPLDKPIAKARIEIPSSSYRIAEIGAASLTPDVDMNIPGSEKRNEGTFALIVGNEAYADKTQLREIDVPFARTDATVFSRYVNQTLGVPAENIVLLTDATKAQMEAAIAKLCRMAETYTKGGAKVIFYYAGHGLCDETRAGYLIPVDISGPQVKYGVKLENLYRKLGELNNVRSTVFIDACFSGGARGGELLAARGIRIEPNKDVISGNLVIFTASSGNQTAFPYFAKQHGMFTYFLLKKLQESSGNVAYGTLSEYLKSEVVHNSVKINDADQTPVTQYSYEVEDSWMEWSLK